MYTISGGNVRGGGVNRQWLTIALCFAEGVPPQLCISFVLVRIYLVRGKFSYR